MSTMINKIAQNTNISADNVAAIGSSVRLGVLKELSNIDEQVNNKKMSAEEAQLKKDVLKCLDKGVEDYMKSKGLLPQHSSVLMNFAKVASNIALTFADYSDNPEAVKIANIFSTITALGAGLAGVDYDKHQTPDKTIIQNYNNNIGSGVNAVTMGNVDIDNSNAGRIEQYQRVTQEANPTQTVTQNPKVNQEINQ